MRIFTIICFAIIFQISVSLLSNTESAENTENNIKNELKYTNKSYFAAIGITGEGKSLFLNAISGQKKFSVSSKGQSETQTVQHVNFTFNDNSFVAIDTPGFDDSMDNSKRIRDLKKLIYDYPTLKCLLIVKKYNTFRLSSSLQEAIKVFMEAFPKENFWDHVIIINTFANPKDENFIDYFKNEKESFIDKIINCPNLRQYMDDKNINMPTNIKEYFIDNKRLSKDKDMQKKLEEIRTDIAKHELMFKKVERSEIIEETEKTSDKTIYIVKKYRKIICTDFNDKQKIIIENVGEEEQRLSEKNRLRSKADKKYIKTDHIRIYDFLSLSLTWWFRTKYYYEISEFDIHKIGNKEIEYQNKPTKFIWE